VKDRPYTVQTPEGRDVVLSSEAHVKELGRSETKGLSMMVYFRDVNSWPEIYIYDFGLSAYSYSTCLIRCMGSRQIK
jgi:hypothetical protein